MFFSFRVWGRSVCVSGCVLVKGTEALSKCAENRHRCDVIIIIIQALGAMFTLLRFVSAYVSVLLYTCHDDEGNSSRIAVTTTTTTATAVRKALWRNRAATTTALECALCSHICYSAVAWRIFIRVRTRAHACLFHMACNTYTNILVYSAMTMSQGKTLHQTLLCCVCVSCVAKIRGKSL